ncbi:MAG: nicotinate-nucleotide adenylyltransferase [Candidatus Eutrophobiaceae bacterium]
MRLIGLFGGAFDPIHLGHLRVAEYARTELAADEIRFLPVSRPAHRALPKATAEQRFAMLKLALDRRGGMILDAREFQRGGISWTVDTLRSLRQEVGFGCAVFFLLGEDAFCRLETWKEWQDLVRYAHLVIYPRTATGSMSESLRQWVAPRLCRDPATLSETPCGSLCRLEGDFSPISSTDVRKSLGAGREARTLLPEAVWQYIEQEKLYQ